MTPSMSYEPLSPAAFLLRAGHVYAERIAVVDGDRRYTYAQFLDRSLRLAGALRALGAIEFLAFERGAQRVEHRRRQAAQVVLST